MRNLHDFCRKDDGRHDTRQFNISENEQYQHYRSYVMSFVIDDN